MPDSPPSHKDPNRPAKESRPLVPLRRSESLTTLEFGRLLELTSRELRR